MDDQTIIDIGLDLLKELGITGWYCSLEQGDKEHIYYRNDVPIQGPTAFYVNIRFTRRGHLIVIRILVEEIELQNSARWQAVFRDSLRERMESLLAHGHFELKNV